METEEKKPEAEIKEQTNVETATENTAPIEETQDQVNWKRFREAREKERKEKIVAEKRVLEKEQEVAALKAAMEAIVNKPNSHQNNEFSEESDQDRIQKLIDETIEKRIQKDQIERERKEHQEFPEKLSRDFKDFDKVCTVENLDYLDYHFPEISSIFKDLPDGYNKWSKVYHAVKKLIPNFDSKKDQAKAEKNFMKPQAMSASGKTPTGDSAPHSLDDKRKTDNWERMQKVMRGAG